MSLSEEYDEIILGSRTLPFYELSPDYYLSFRAYGYTWRTLIHYWLAISFLGNDYKINWIRNQDTTQMALNCAKKCGFTDFNSIDSKVFLYGIQERFNQNDNLRSILLSTGSVYLRYKGLHYLEENNRYGKILMRLREIYSE